MDLSTSTARLLACLSTSGLLACSSGASEPAQRTTSADRSGGGTQWGAVLGSVRDATAGGPINVSDTPDAIACDYAQLGLSWVRVDIGDGTGDLSPFTTFVSIAHARGIRVLLLVHPDDRACEVNDASCGDVNAWAGAYVGRINQLVDGVFTGAVSADAYEIGNEPNGGQSHITPTSFAFLLNAVWQGVKKAPHASSFQIVSGGLLNTYTTESWWQSFLAALPSEQPWDVFAIHPYDKYSYAGRDVSAWAADVSSTVGALQGALSAQYGHPSRLWATEVGFSSAPSGDDSAGDESGQSATFAGVDAALSGITEVAFWYDYRDDEPGPSTENNVFGVRHASASGYRPKPLYGAIAQALGAPGDPNACYFPQGSPTPAPPSPTPTPGPGPTPQPSAAACGQLAAQSGWQSPLCDQGSGICEGAGSATSDCSLCCDASMITCGGLAAGVGWQSPLCDNGSGVCNGGGPMTNDCAHCCNQP